MLQFNQRTLLTRLFWTFQKKKKRFRMWKQKQNSLKENTHLHSETKTKLTTTASGRWKHKKSKNTWQEETRNTKWKWFQWLTTDSTKMIQQEGGDQQVVYKQRTLVIHETKWENKDSKHKRMTWMKVSASKQHTHKHDTSLESKVWFCKSQPLKLFVA